MNYLSKVWSHRHFWLALVESDLRSRYRGSILGIGWSLLNPIAMTTLLACVFSSVLRVNPWEYAPYILLGMSLWNYLHTCVLGGCQAIRFAEGYIRQVPLPVAIYPLRVTLSAGFHFVVSGILAIALVAVTHGLETKVLLPWLLPELLLLLALGWSLGTVAALHTVRFSDARHLLEVLLQFVFLLTPVLYPVEVLTEHGRSWMLNFNPVHHLLIWYRVPILEGRAPPVESVAFVTCVTAITVAWAVRTLAKREPTIIFEL